MAKKANNSKKKEPIEDEFIESNINDDEELELVEELPFDTEIKKKKEEARKLEEKLRKEKSSPIGFITTIDGEEKIISELNILEREIEIAKCGTDPIYFIQNYLTIFDQTKSDDGQIVLFKLFQFQKDLITNYYMKHKFVITNKYRQAGISTTTCAYLAWYIMFNDNRNVAVVADLLGTAESELLGEVALFIDSCPTWLKPEIVKNTQVHKTYDNGSSIHAFAAKSGLRGYTPQIIFFDEVAHTSDAESFVAGAMPSLQTGGGMFMVSTPGGFDSTFYKTVVLAKKNENKFKYCELFWFEDPRYNKNLNWIKNKGQSDEIKIKDDNWSKIQRLKMIDDGFKATSPFFDDQVKLANNDLRKIAQELECSFLGSGYNYIPAKYLELIEQKQLCEPIKTDYLDNNLWIWENEELDSEYIMGIDVASGFGEDFSSINVIKIDKTIIEKIKLLDNGREKKIRTAKYEITQVAEYYGKITPRNLANLAFQIGTRYNGAYCIVDIGSGDGTSTVTEMLDMGYQNIYYGSIKLKAARELMGGYIKHENRRNPDGTNTMVDLLPGIMINEKRAAIFSYFQSCITNESSIIKSKRLYEELKTFMNVGGSRVCDHRKGAHDDSIVSFALAIYVLYTDDRRIKNNKAEASKMIDMLIAINSPTMVSGGTKNNIKKQINTAFNMGGNPFNPNPYFQYQWMFKGLK